MPRDAVSTIYVRVWHRIVFYRVPDKSKCCTIDKSDFCCWYVLLCSFRTWTNMTYRFEAFVCAQRLSRIICFGSNGMFKLLLDAMIYYGARYRCTRITTNRSEYPGCIESRPRILISFSCPSDKQWRSDVFPSMKYSHESRFMNEKIRILIF